MSTGIERVVTHGTFELDGGSWEVDNNIWLVGDDKEVIVIDAAHDATAIEDAVGGRHEELDLVPAPARPDEPAAVRDRFGHDPRRARARHSGCGVGQPRK